MQGGLKAKDDISGLCSGGAAHHLCRGEWTTPSVQVRCVCKCHVRVAIVPKTLVAKTLVKKSR